MAANDTTPAERPAPPAGLHLAILIAAGLLLWATTCGLWDLQGPDEGRYVQVAKELLARGNWLVLTVGGDLYDEKLPPPFWALATLLRVTGGEPSAWLLRLPAVFAAIATVAMTYLIGRGLYGWRAGWIAAWIAMATPLVMENAPEAKLDMIFTGFVVLSLAPWLMRAPDRPLPWPQAVLMWAAMIGAIFYKGPLALVILLSVIGAEARARRSWGVFNQARTIWGIFGLALFFIGWYKLQQQFIGAKFVQTQLSEQLWQRVLHGDHGAPPWYYLPRIFGVFFPWSLLLIPIAIDFWKRRAIPAPVRPVAAWFLIPFLILSLASGKRQVYLLPLMPALALLAGWWLAPRLSKARSPKWVRPWAGGLLIAIGAAIPVFYLALYAIPKLATTTHIAPDRTIVAVSLVIGVLVILSGQWIFTRSADPSRLFAAVVAALLLYGFSNYTCLEPGRNAYYSTRSFAGRVDREMRARGLKTLGGIGQAAKAEYFIYGHTPARRFEEDQIRGKAPMPGPLTDVLVVDDRDLKDVGKALGRENYRPLFAQTVAGDSLRVYVK